MPVQMLTDHKELKYFMTTKKLIPKQANWAEFLLEFNFVISYQSGKKNNKANTFTQKLGDCLADKENERLEHHMQMLLPPEYFKHSIKLQIIERKKDTHVHAKTPNSTSSSAVGQTEPCGTDEPKDFTLLEKVSKAN